MALPDQPQFKRLKCLCKMASLKSNISTLCWNNIATNSPFFSWSGQWVHRAARNVLQEDLWHVLSASIQLRAALILNDSWIYFIWSITIKIELCMIFFYFTMALIRILTRRKKALFQRVRCFLPGEQTALVDFFLAFFFQRSGFFCSFWNNCRSAVI